MITGPPPKIYEVRDILPIGSGRHRQAPDLSSCSLSLSRSCCKARARVGPIAPGGIPVV
jgi:hypothetical protein